MTCKEWWMRRGRGFHHCWRATQNNDLRKVPGLEQISRKIHCHGDKNLADPQLSSVKNELKCIPHCLMYIVKLGIGKGPRCPRNNKTPNTRSITEPNQEKRNSRPTLQADRSRPQPHTATRPLSLLLVYLLPPPKSPPTAPPTLFPPCTRPAPTFCPPSATGLTMEPAGPGA